MATVVPIGLYGVQHYVSILGSLVLIPLVIVPAMGGTHVSSFFIIYWSFSSFVSFIANLLHVLCYLMHLVAIGGYFDGGFNDALHGRSDYTFAFNFWV